MQDRPTAPELLEAMAAQLFSEVREWVPRERRFQVLVLANLCGVIARELRAGYEPSLADVALFRELAGEDGPVPEPEDAGAEAREGARELSWLIRRGQLDDDLPQAIVRLREHVRRKLAVARPGYASEESGGPGGA
jgi:hypothetical protein